MEPDADRSAATRRDAIRYCGAGAGLPAGYAGTEPTDGSPTATDGADG